MASKRKKTGFDKFFDEQIRDTKFREGYEKIRSEIDVVDGLVRALDTARMDLNLSKAELARRIAAEPAMIRRLFTADQANPTLATVVKIAEALGYDLSLIPKASSVPKRAKTKPRRRKPKKRLTRTKKTADAA
jgi:transcriptional regulator with XRE-family HTH domain